MIGAVMLVPDAYKDKKVFQFWDQDGRLCAMADLGNEEWAIYGLKLRNERKWYKAKKKRGGFGINQSHIDELPEELRLGASVVHSHSRLIHSTPTEASNYPGDYQPRIWRGRYYPYETWRNVSCPTPNLNSDEFYSSMRSSQGIFSYLESIFQYVEPSENNMSVFGYKFRELLILACTEVEANLKSVFKLNFLGGPKSLSTKHYIKLLRPMRLDKWSVRLKYYPGIKLNPFENWIEEKSSQSIPWYDGYNDVKHDRESKFHRATMDNVLNSLAALHIVLCAQWGPGFLESTGLSSSDFTSPFLVDDQPKYELGQFYLPPFDFEELEMPWKVATYESRNQD